MKTVNKYHLVMIRTLYQLLRKELARQCDVPQGHYVTLFVLLSSDWWLGEQMDRRRGQSLESTVQ